MNFECSSSAYNTGVLNIFQKISIWFVCVHIIQILNEKSFYDQTLELDSIHEHWAWRFIDITVPRTLGALFNIYLPSPLWFTVLASPFMSASRLPVNFMRTWKLKHNDLIHCKSSTWYRGILELYLPGTTPELKVTRNTFVSTHFTIACVNLIFKIPSFLLKAELAIW